MKKELTLLKKELTPMKTELTPLKEFTPLKKELTPLKELTRLKKELTPLGKPFLLKSSLNTGNARKGGVVVVFGRTSGRGNRAPPVPRVDHEYGRLRRTSTTEPSDSYSSSVNAYDVRYAHRSSLMLSFLQKLNKGALTCR